LVHYDEEVRRRSRVEPYCKRKVTVTSVITRDYAEYTVEDEGNGFDPKSIPDDIGETENLTSHGRGLLLIKAFMDSVTFNERGNRITMVKRAPTK